MENRKIKGKISCNYGENAWQNPAHISILDTDDLLSMAHFKVIEGSEPSWNNWRDIDRSLQTVTHVAEGFRQNFNKKDIYICVGVKHGNACGVFVGDTKKGVLTKMRAGDPISIFGGVIMTNFEIDEVVHDELKEILLDVIVAPKISSDSIDILKRKNGRCRFVVNEALFDLEDSLDTNPRDNYIRGGVITQPNYTFVPNLNDESITKYSKANEQQEEDIILAWAIGSTSNSNTITLVKDGQLLSNGTGQQDRVGAAKLAIEKAKRSDHDLQGSVAYSDSFFPFSDGPQILIDAGVSAIFTSSGSIRDKDTIDLCEKSEVPLYMVPDKLGRGFFAH